MLRQKCHSKVICCLLESSANLFWFALDFKVPLQTFRVFEFLESQTCFGSPFDYKFLVKTWYTASGFSPLGGVLFHGSYLSYSGRDVSRSFGVLGG